MLAGNTYQIEHVSRYLYTQPVTQCSMSLCLKPSERMGQRLLDFAVHTEPDATLSEETDPFGNTKHLMHVHAEHDSLAISARSVVRDCRSRAAARNPRAGRLGRHRTLEDLHGALGADPPERLRPTLA